MNRFEILHEVNNVFAVILDDEKIKIDELTTASGVEGWDSLTHIHLVMSIEKRFKIRFKSKEIQIWSNVGGMIDSIETKLNAI